LVLSPVNSDTAVKIKELALEESSAKAIGSATALRAIAIEPQPQLELEAIATEADANTEEFSDP
jgi:hypothetical protein